MLAALIGSNALAVDHGFAIGRSHLFDAFANDRPNEERNLFQGLFGIKTPFHRGNWGVVHGDRSVSTSSWASDPHAGVSCPWSADWALLHRFMDKPAISLSTVLSV